MKVLKSPTTWIVLICLGLGALALFIGKLWAGRMINYLGVILLFVPLVYLFLEWNETHGWKGRRRTVKVTYTKRDDAFYKRAAAQIDAIEAEMKRVGLWQNTPLQPEQYDFRAAFAGDTMAFPQWLQFIFIPNVRQIVDTKGAFPSSSQVAAYAVREFDTYREDTNTLIQLLSDFDHLF